MEPKTSTSGSTFARVLRSVQTGGVAYHDFLVQVDQLVREGASPAELLEILERRESVEALPENAHEAVVRLLNKLQPRPPRDAAVPAEAPTIILGEPETGSGKPEAANDSAPPAKVGDVLGNRFRLIELIGQGGMSRVYKAIDLQPSAAASSAVQGAGAETSAGGGASTSSKKSANASEVGGAGEDNFIAVKVLARPFREDAAAFSILQNEFQTLKSLTHPNIVQMFACDREASTVFITMEYLTGQSLYHRMHSQTAVDGSQPRIAREDALSVITTVATALDHAHQNLVVHGDLKPGNVIITHVGEVKVIDFGIATWIMRPRSALERREAAQRQSTAAVTPRYASPQLMARQRPETTDDIYALACLAYELLTGSHPFDDNGSQTVRTPPPLREGLTPPQYAAITKGLQAEKRNRTATVRQFIEEFSAPARRIAWKTPALLCGLALLLAAGGWVYIHRMPRETAEQTSAVPTPTDEAASPPVPVAAPAAPAARPGTVIRDCPTCPQMTVLPIGDFDQGSGNAAEGSAYERPQHRVTIAYPLAMANHTVTVGEFRDFVTATRRDMQGCEIYEGEWRHKAKASWQDPGFVQSDSHPVTCVSWRDATAYAQWLSTNTGHRYRLPSASEWEYAARAGSAESRPWGGDGAVACANANVADQSAARRYPGWSVFPCDDGYVNTAPVSTFKANPFGLDDMLGNVFQWTQDCWHADYSGAPTDGSPRMDGDCKDHELRGGSWFSSPPYVRAAYRNHFAADYRTSSVGFRLVRENTP